MGIIQVSLSGLLGLELYRESNHRTNTLERRHNSTIELTIEKYYSDTAPRGKGFNKSGKKYKYIEEECKKKRN